jgi:hypothetical protein
MQSTTPQNTDPHDVFVIEPDVVLASRQASPDPVQELLSHLAHKAAEKQPTASVVPHVTQVSVAPEISVVPEAPPVAPTPAAESAFRAAPIDTTDRAVVTNDRAGIGWWLRRASIAFVFALCSAFAAAAWTHHGAAARHLMSNWLPPSILAALPGADKPAAAEQPDPAPVQADAADQAPAQPAVPTQSTDGAAPAAAAATATPAAAAAVPTATAAPVTATAATEATPSAQSMAHDLKTMGQQIEQLKASIEQLKANQAQMLRENAKNSEARISDPGARPKAAASASRPVAAIPPRPAAPRKPKTAYLPPPPAITSPAPGYVPSPAFIVPPGPPPPSPQPVGSQQPMASQPAPLPEATTVPSDDGPVIRPPMPLR